MDSFWSLLIWISRATAVLNLRQFLKWFKFDKICKFSILILLTEYCEVKDKFGDYFKGDGGDTCTDLVCWLA
jgi:hypothetical protein